MNKPTREPQDVTVDDFLYTSIAIGRFMRVCSSLPTFSSDFTFLHCLVLFVVNGEPHGLSMKVLCRQIGLALEHGRDTCRELKAAGFLSTDGDGLQLTAAGRSKLNDTSLQLLPLIQAAVDHPQRFRNLVKFLRSMTRAWTKGKPASEEAESLESGD